MKYPKAQIYAASLMPKEDARAWLVSQPEVRRWLDHLINSARGGKAGRPRADDSQVIAAMLAAAPDETRAKSQTQLILAGREVCPASDSTIRRAIDRLVASGRLVKVSGINAAAPCSIYATGR